MHGVVIDETDIFGRRGKKKIEEAASRLAPAENIVMSDMLAESLK